MDIKLLELFNELIDEFDNSELIKEINKLKQDIYNDKELSILLEQFKRLNEYDANYIEIKRKIIENDKIKRFRELEHDLNYLIRKINKKLKSLAKEKRCIL